MEEKCHPIQQRCSAVAAKLMTIREETENYKKLRDAIIGSLTRKLYLTIPPVESFSELLNYKEAQSWLDTFQLLQKWTESESLDLYFLHVHR